jgi:hypothetical protein
LQAFTGEILVRLVVGVGESVHYMKPGQAAARGGIAEKHPDDRGRRGQQHR